MSLESCVKGNDHRAAVISYFIVGLLIWIICMLFGSNIESLKWSHSNRSLSLSLSLFVCVHFLKPTNPSCWLDQVHFQRKMTSTKSECTSVDTCMSSLGEILLLLSKWVLYWPIMLLQKCGEAVRYEPAAQVEVSWLPQYVLEPAFQANIYVFLSNNL